MIIAKHRDSCQDHVLQVTPLPFPKFCTHLRARDDERLLIADTFPGILRGAHCRRVLTTNDRIYGSSPKAWVCTQSQPSGYSRKYLIIT